MSIRIISKICGWLLIVWLACLPLGMVGCGEETEKPVQETKKQDIVSVIIATDKKIRFTLDEVEQQAFVEEFCHIMKRKPQPRSSDSITQFEPDYKIIVKFSDGSQEEFEVYGRTELYAMKAYGDYHASWQFNMGLLYYKKLEEMIKSPEIVISFKDLKGLKKGCEVVTEGSGAVIGKVKDIKALADEFFVTIELKQEVELYKNTKARVIGISLLGGEAIKIIGGSGEKLKSGEVLAGEH